MKIYQNSLKVRLFFYFMLVVFFVLLVFFTGVSFLIKEHLLHMKQNELWRKGFEIVAYFQEIEGISDISNNEAVKQKVLDYIALVDNYIEARVWVVDVNKKILGISSAPKKRKMFMGDKINKHKEHILKPLLYQKEEETVKKFIEDSLGEGSLKRQIKVLDNPFYQEKMIVVSVPFKDLKGEKVGTVILNAPLMEISIFMERIYYYLTIAALVGVLCSLFLVQRLVKSIILPLKLMQSATEEIKKGNYDVYIPVANNDEVGNLGNAMNSLVKELSLYMAEVNKQEQLRRDFVANVSHELKTPLTIIRGYTEALLDGTVEEKEKFSYYLLQIKEESLRLERLVCELLSLSRLQKEKLLLEAIPLNEIVLSVVEKMQKKAEKKGIELKVNCDFKVAKILANEDKLIQLVLIILDNAVKYTEYGGLVSIMTKCFKEDDLGKVALIIEDNGIGILKEDLPYIWERFYKADKAHSRVDDDSLGLGLGLAIAKQILLLHNATFNVESEKGRGSKFEMIFPCL